MTPQNVTQFGSIWFVALLERAAFRKRPSTTRKTHTLTALAGSGRRSSTKYWSTANGPRGNWVGAPTDAGSSKAVSVSAAACVRASDIKEGLDIIANVAGEGRFNCQRDSRGRTLLCDRASLSAHTHPPHS